MRTRTCTGPFHGGQPCVGDAQEKQFCNDNPCPGAYAWTFLGSREEKCPQLELVLTVGYTTCIWEPEKLNKYDFFSRFEG